MKRCYKCQKIFVEPGPIGFQQICEGCGSYLHCCMDCNFHDEDSHNHCREPQAEFVSDANGMNRCEYFVFKDTKAFPLLEDQKGTPGHRHRPDWRNLGGRAAGGYERRGGRSASGKPSANGKAARARDALEKLFGGA